MSGLQTAHFHNPCLARPQVDFAAVYNKLTSLGATIDKTKYLYPEKILAPRL